LANSLKPGKSSHTIDRILVIKHGALGDFVLALPAMAAIRKHHPDADITLLTTGPFIAMAAESGYFDHAWLDNRPRWNPLGWARLILWLNRNRFTRVYDLQTSGRSSFYYRLFRQKPEWCGIAKGCSHPDPTPDRAALHAFDLRVAQLKAAGITDIPPPDLSWLTQGNRLRTRIPEGAKLALLVTGASAHRPEKRWPVTGFAGLAAKLQEQGYTPVIIGDIPERETARLIALTAPSTIDLTGDTTLFDIADVARDAVLAVGNDTGPMHLIAATGCPSLVLFSGASFPHHSSPRGRAVCTLQRDTLADLSVEEVLDTLPQPA
jgi:ADP-heptose:LPS heptosyltransferase